MTTPREDYHQGRQLAAGVYEHDDEIHVDEAELVRALGGSIDDDRLLLTIRRVVASACGELQIPYQERYD